MSRSDGSGDSKATTSKLTSPETSRRRFLKGSGAAAAGAMGALAGCTSGENDEEDPTSSNPDTDDNSNDDSGGQETVTIEYLSAQAVENADTKSHFQDSMSVFEEKQDGVTVNLQTASYGDIKEKLSSTVSSGNPPSIAESGSGGLQWFFQGKIPDHKPFLEKTDGMPDDFTTANQESAKFRGEYWSGGALRHTSSNLGIHPKHFSQVGVENPHEDLATWSQFYDAIKSIDEQIDGTFAYEETGVYNDLESYWGQARTAYTGGKDPWLRGDPENPEVVIGSDHEDADKTDGMIKNCIHLADQFSSQESAQRGDEEIPSLMLTGRVSAFTYATPTANRWRAVKENVKIGWHGGNGDYMLLPNPKLDADYGSKVGISELEGAEGEHGGHVWALEQQQTVFNVDEAKQNAAWDLNMFLLRDPEFVLPMWGEYYEAIPGLAPMGPKVLNEYDLVQSTAQSYKNLNEYGDQYASTGAAWDVKGTDQIRWTDINETISQAIAGQHSAEDTPGLINDRVSKTLKAE